MLFPLAKTQRRTYLLQIVGFMGLVLFTIMTVVVGNTVYQYASVLQEEEQSSQEGSYAIFNKQPEGTARGARK